MKILVFIVGLALLTEAGLILFNKRYFEMMRRIAWDKSQYGKNLFPGKYGFYYDKYYRAALTIMRGLFALFLALFVVGK